MPFRLKNFSNLSFFPAVTNYSNRAGYQKLPLGRKKMLRGLYLLTMLLNLKEYETQTQWKILRSSRIFVWYPECRTVPSSYLNTILLGLHIPKRGILSSASQKFLVGALFDKSPTLQNQNAVSHAN